MEKSSFTNFDNVRTLDGFSGTFKDTGISNENIAPIAKLVNK